METDREAHVVASVLALPGVSSDPVTAAEVDRLVRSLTSPSDIAEVIS